MNTDINKDVCHSDRDKLVKTNSSWWKYSAKNGVRTVDGDRHAFGQHIAVCTLERGDLAQLVELEVFVREAFSRLSVNELDVEIVCLGNRENRRSARVGLRIC